MRSSCRTIRGRRTSARRLTPLAGSSDIRADESPLAPTWLTPDAEAAEASPSAEEDEASSSSEDDKAGPILSCEGLDIATGNPASVVVSLLDGCLRSTRGADTGCDNIVAARPACTCDASNESVARSVYLVRDLLALALLAVGVVSVQIDEI